MSKLDIPPNVTFLQMLGLCEEYAYPLREMWPSFWLKAAAIHDGKQWRLSYFALIARWSDAAAEPLWEPGEALVAVSKKLAPGEAWDMLATLVTDGCIALSDSVLAHIADVPVPQYAQYQEAIPSMLKTTVDVAAQARWRWLYLYGYAQWLANASPVYGDVQRRIQVDVDRQGLPNYQQFIHAHFGSGAYNAGDMSFDMLQYHLDFPLALQIAPSTPISNQGKRSFAIACRSPMTLDQAIVTSGNRHTSQATPTPIEQVHQADDGWAVGTISIPLDHGKVWLASPLMYRTLLAEITLPTPESQVNDILAYIYNSRKPDKGGQDRDKQLLEGKDDILEIALLNALARFGVPALFAGQIKRLAGAAATTTATSSAQAGSSGPKASGPATPGFDLVALDYQHRRAVLLSAKGVAYSPGDDDIENLLAGVRSISSLLEGWYVTGLIACHASATRLVRIRARGDLVVWGQDELALLQRAEMRDAVLHLLWTPPGQEQVDLFRGYR